MSTRAILLLLALTAPAAAQTCTPQAAQQFAAQALGLQAKLLAVPVGDGDIDIPQPVRPVLHDFKQALARTVDAAVACNAAPAQIQASLATLLHANNPIKQPDAKSVAPYKDVYGADLAVHASAAPNMPDLLAVQLSFDISCGDDNALFIYRHSPAGWKRELAYYNPDLNLVSDGIGDFFTWSFVPGPNNQPLFAAAHGTPWCSSRMSGFKVDLIAPSNGNQSQKTVAHYSADYSRGDDVVTIKATGDGFQLRAPDDSLDFDNLFVRPRVYRFRTTAGTLDRIQPVADNARDFVDVWLQQPWPEVSHWAAPTTPALKSIHDRFDSNLNKDKPSVSYGPVFACGNQQFQLELDLMEGPKLDNPSKLFAKVQQGATAFTLLGFTPTQDPTCKGPDLMKRAR